MDDRLQHNNNKRRASESSDAFHSNTKKKKGRWVYVEEDETTITTQQDNSLLQNSTHHVHNYPIYNHNHFSHQYQPPQPLPPPYPPHIMATTKALDKERKMKQRIDMMEMELNKLKSMNNSNTQYRPPPIISKPPPPPRPIAKRVSEAVKTSHHHEKPRRKVAATFTKNGYHPRIMLPANSSTKNDRLNSRTPPPPPLVHQVSISTSYEDEKTKNNMHQNTANRYTSNEPPLVNTSKLVERKRDVFEERMRSESSSMKDKKKAYSSRGLWYRTGVQDAVKGMRMHETISTTQEEDGSTNIKIKGKEDIGKGRIVHQDIIHTEGYKKRQDEVTMLLQMTNGYTFCGHRGCKNKASVGGLCCRDDCVALKHEASRMLQEAIQSKGTCHDPTDVINTMPADPIVLPSLGGFTPEEYEIRVKWKRMRDVQQRKVPWRKKYTYQQKENPSAMFSVDPVHRPETFLQRWERVAAKYDIANMNIDSPPKHFKRVESHSVICTFS